MNILKEIIQSNKPTVAALGFFDGVHSGHQKVLKAAVDFAKKNEMVSAVITFDKSPSVFLSESNKEIITENQEKCEIFNFIGINTTYMLSFEKFMNMYPEEFIENVLIKTLNVKHIFCGFNYHFGKNGKGNCNDLKKICANHNVGVTVVEPILFKDETISSSRIRECIKQGDINLANEMLGHPVSLCGKVVSGRKLGKKLGFPTINQDICENHIIPKFGVYASLLEYNGKKYPAVTNIGIKPTVGSDKPVSETWVFDYDLGNLYGKNVIVSLLEFIRAEKKFSGQDELRENVLNDAKAVKKLFEEKCFSMD